MHVVVIAHTRFPIRQPFAGGLESFTWHLARGLVAHGHRVSVFAARGSEELPGVEHLWPDTTPVSEVAQADVSMPEARWMERHHAHLRLMMSLAHRDDVDIVHSNSLHYLPAAMAPLVPARSVLTLHTPPTPWLESALRVAQDAPGHRPLVAAVSRYTARAWSHLVTPAIVPNGVDTQVWGRGPGGDALVWSGRIVPEKAPHLAVQIARRAGMPLTLAGPVSDEAYAEEVLWPLLGGEVTYAGHLRTPELAELVGSSAAALVTPAWEEPFGLVAAEALSCGTPVLGLDRGGVSEVVGPDAGRTVPVRDAAGGILPDEEIVARAAAALPEVLAVPREMARERAERHLSVDRMVEDYLRLYACATPGGAA